MDYTKKQKPMSYLERYVATKGVGGALQTAGGILSGVSGSGTPSFKEGMKTDADETEQKNPELYSGKAKPPVQGSVDESTSRLRDLTGLGGTKGLY